MKSFLVAREKWYRKHFLLLTCRPFTGIDASFLHKWLEQFIGRQHTTLFHQNTINIIIFIVIVIIMNLLHNYLFERKGTINTQVITHPYTGSPSFPSVICVVMWTLSKPPPSNPPESPRFPKQGKRLWNSASSENTVKLKTPLSVGVCGLRCGHVWYSRC